MKRHLLSAAIASTLCTQAYAEQLDPVVVTANKLEQPLSHVTDTTYIITREEINANGWETLTDALQHIPGVSFTRNGGLGSTTNLYLRGQSGNAILVMIDGIQIADPSQTSLAPLFENLMLADVERIEVIMGPQSSVWGSNASAGVINIITQGGKKNRFSITAGSENTRAVHTKLNAGNERLSFTTSFNTIATDGFTAIKPYGTSGHGHERDGYDQRDVAFDLRFSPVEHHSLDAGYRQSDSDLAYDTTYPTYNPDDSASNTNTHMTLKYLRYRYQHKAWKARVQLSENKTERNYFGNYTGILTNGEAQLDLHYTKENALSFAGGTQRVKGEQPGNYGFKAAYWHDFYGLTHNHKLGSVRLVEAIRHDNFNAFKDKTTGKLGFKAPFLKSFTLSANYGTAYNAPSAYQIANISPTKQKVQLKPEATEGWDATLSYGNLSLTRFVSQTQHMIRYDDVGYTGYYNLDGTAHFRGWTFTYYKDFASLAFQLNGTLQEARDDQGKQLKRVPKQMADATLEYFGLPRTQLTATLHYVGDTYETAGTDQINLGRYTTVDVAANYYLNRDFTLFAKAINLLDRDYYLATDQKNPPQYGYNTGGFQWRIGLHGKF